MAGAGDSSADSLAAMIDELQAMREQLLVADEELRTQDEELAAARARLATAQERYAEMFEAAPVAYLLTTDAGIVVEANAAAGTLLRAAPRRGTGKPLDVLVASESRHTLRSLLRALRLGAGLVTDSLTFPAPPGPGLTVSVSATCSIDPHTGARWMRWALLPQLGQIGAVPAAGSAQAGDAATPPLPAMAHPAFSGELEVDLAIVSAILDSDDAVFVTDLTGVITHWGRGAAEALGVAAYDALGRFAVDVGAVPSGGDETGSVLFGRVAAGEAVLAAHKISTPQGRAFPVSVRLFPVRAGLGNVVGVLARVHPVEDGPTSVVERVSKDSLLSAVTEDARIAVVTLNSHLRVQHASASWGWPAEGDAVSLSALLAEGAAAIEDVARRCLNGESLATGEVWAKPRHGASPLRRWSVCCRALESATSDPVGVHCILVDTSAEVAEQRRADRAAALDAASRALSSALGVQGVVEAVESVCVPFLADSCRIDLSRTASRSAVSVVGPRTMTLPLVTSGDTLGTMRLARSEEGAAFDSDTAELARLLAERAAEALASAVAYDRANTVARILQHSMRPELPSRLAGNTLAGRYVPGNRHAEVGGDWIDAVALSSDRVAFVVGDVVGHDISSAAMMSRLRSSVRALGRLDLEPLRVLQHLDALVADAGNRAFATCAYVVHDPAEGLLSIANAGHLPLILVRAGRALPLDIPPGVPLGTGDSHDFSCTEVEVRNGDVIGLYTDGMVETPAANIDRGIDDLRRALARRVGAAPGDLERVADLLLARVPIRVQRRDDLSLLLATLHVPSEDSDVRVSLRPEPRSAELARARVAQSLAQWRLSALTDDVALVVTELVAESIRDGVSRIQVRVRHVDESVYVEVWDDGVRQPLRAAVAVDEEGGRELQVIEAVAHRSGSRMLSGGGRIVWAELGARVEEPAL